MITKYQLQQQVEQQFSDPKYTIDRMARENFTHRSNFYRIFKKLFGVSPCSYLSNRRMLAAHEMIARGARVKEAAFRSGFSDPAYFSRCYKNRYGISPSRFKKATLKLQAY